MHRTVLYACLFCSGFAGLVWQILWVRQLSLAFGSTVHAVSIVTAIFLVGLGAGAQLTDVIIEKIKVRTAVLIGAWAACEFGVAIWGLALVPVFEWLGRNGFGDTTPDSNGWMVTTMATRLGEAGLTALLIAPPTLLMGASLPLLSRCVLGNQPASAVGQQLGRLAAANTGGAAFAALLTDLCLVPALGVRGTQGAAAAAGLLAVAGAAWASRFEIVDRSTGISEEEGRIEPLPLRNVLASVTMASFAAMGFEVLWFRFLGSALGPYRAVFSMLLGILLLGWMLGALLGGTIERRITRPVLLFAGTEFLLSALALAGLASHQSRTLLERQRRLSTATPDVLPLLEHILNGWTIAAVILPAAIAMGTAFPLLNAIGVSQRRAGRNVGAIWLATTLGNAGGALGIGLGVLPALGLQNTALFLALVAMFSPMPLWRALPKSLGWGVLCGGLTLLGYAHLPAQTLLWASFPYGRIDQPDSPVPSETVLATREDINETLVVTGSTDGSARLWTNGHPMSSTTPHAQRYMRLMAHLPLLAMEDPRRVLVICFGVGNTLEAASLHPTVTRLDLADISADVLAMAPLFTAANHQILYDPRVHVYVEDGRHVLQTMAPDSYDLITLEPPPIAQAGVASLYTREFYTLAQEHLRVGGWITQWLPAYQVPAETVLALVRSFVDVFPDAVLLVGDGRELFLAGVKGGIPVLDASRVEERMRSNPTLTADLERINIQTVNDLVQTFAASGDQLRQATRSVAAMTDDRPVAESSAVSHIRRTQLPASLFAPGAWPSFCPQCAADSALATQMDELAAHWSSPEYLNYTNLSF